MKSYPSIQERNFDSVGAARHGGDVMCPNEGYVVISNNELMCGNLAKKTLGSGSKKVRGTSISTYFLSIYLFVYPYRHIFASNA